MVRVRSVSYHTIPLRTRMPFRYGIAELRETPHLFVRLELDVAGRPSVGLAADNLPPKWFTKDPATPFSDDLRDMTTVIRAAGQHALDAGASPTVFDLWQRTYAAQKSWAAATPYPPLLWNFGVSLIERAMIDAFCRATATPFHTALRTGQLGLTDAVQLRPELAGQLVRDLLPNKPRRFICVRHTVGLTDPLTGNEIPPGNRLDDGLPQTLDEAIQAYGLRYFKIKLSGDAGHDRDRLRRIARLLDEKYPDYRHTLDGNENFASADSFYNLWDSLSADPALQRFLSRLLFVEQPLHRDVALLTDLTSWARRPTMIIDESDANFDSLPDAISRGYHGTSHKNCKGIFKSVANRATIVHLRLTRGGLFVHSGEDLTNTGPVALPQDLAVLATLGISHAERNAHHYFRGLSQFPHHLQNALLSSHPDLYEQHPQGFATTSITNGHMSTISVSSAPFGYALDFDPRQFPPLE